MNNCISINYHQAKELVKMFELDIQSCDSPDEAMQCMVLMDGDGHSGPGLYATIGELPEEGAFFIPESKDVEVMINE